MLLRHTATLAGAAIALAIALAACGGGDDDRGGGADAFDAGRAYEDVRAQVELGPRPAGSAAGRRLVRWITGELRAAGVRDVVVQRPYRNVVATIPGTRPGVVVAGAHHDTKDIPGFVGANDGASGVAVLLGLARALPQRIGGSAIQLVFFDAEEARGERPFSADGTRGSRQYVAYARQGRSGSAPLSRIRAMVLFDLVGDCDLQIPREAGSDPALYRLFADASRALDGDPEPFTGETAGIADDHVPFLRAGVPAVDLIDFTFGGPEPPGIWWHTLEDTPDKICESSLDAVGEAALVALGRIAAAG